MDNQTPTSNSKKGLNCKKSNFTEAVDDKINKEKATNENCPVKNLKKRRDFIKDDESDSVSSDSDDSYLIISKNV